MTNSLNYMKTGPKVGLENAKNVDYEAFLRTMHQLVLLTKNHLPYY